LTKKFFPVPESQNSIPTTNSTLAQLLEIDTQLSIQEAQLHSQLESLQQKRNSLKVVIELFNVTDAAIATPVEETTATSQTPPETASQTASQADIELASQESLTTPSPTSTSPKEKKKGTSSSKKIQARKTKPSKTTKQVIGWQQYLREEFRNSSLPQAISSVLYSQDERVWDIAAVVDAIFVEEIPIEVKKKVRLQITNLLAQGARENKWYREQQGSYTLSSQGAKSKTR
jgi:hypothetical protein